MRQAATSLRRYRELRRSRNAQMPFSIIAVLLLVLSSASIALVYGLEEGRSGSAIPAHLLSRMKEEMSSQVQAVHRLAYSVAAETIKVTTDLNETKVQEAFSTAMNGSLASSYPFISNDITAVVEQDLQLSFLRASIEEQYARDERNVSWQGASIPAYFAITGNFSITVSCPAGHLNRTVQMNQEVYVPLPLLMDRLNRFSGSATPRGELESMVRYELSALAQDRVLRGYGMSAKTGPMSTMEIITEEDVVRAINMALIMEELRYFHDADTPDPEVQRLLPEDIIGLADPADLFLRSYGQGGIDLAPIVAQTIYARLDAVVLKWMEYYGFIDLVNLGDDIMEGTANSVLDTVGLLTGSDLEQEAVTGYILDALVDAGIPEYNYRWFCYGSGDGLVTLPEYRISLVDDKGNFVQRAFGGTYSVDFPAADVLSSPLWGEVSRQYRDETYLVAQAMSSYLRAIAGAVASRCALPIVDLELDPTDGRDFLDELDDQLRAAFADDSAWLKPAMEAAERFSEVREGLAQALIDFIDQRWADLFRMNASVYQAASDLSATLVRPLNGTSNFSAPSIAEAQKIIFAELLGDHWGARETLQDAFKARADPFLDAFNTALSQRTEERNLLADLLSYGVSDVPCMERILADAAFDTIASARAGVESQGGATTIPVAEGGIALTLSDGQQRTENIRVTTLGGADLASTAVKITQPWEQDRSSTVYPNRHVTNLLDLTATPFTTQWGIEYHGTVTIEVALSSSEDGASILPFTATIPLDGSFNVLTFSGWNLIGVEYVPTTTLLQEVKDLLLDIWDFLVSSVQAVGSFLGKAFDLFTKIMSDLLSCATAPLEFLNDLLTQTVERLTDLTQSLASTVIQALSDPICSVMNGTTARISILGVVLALTIGPSDSSLIGAEDRLRADLTLSALGATLTSSVRILKLGNGQHTIAATATLGGEDWSVDLTLDPLLKVYDHQVEVRGFLGGHIFEMVAPEVERVQKVSFSLSDIPLLSIALKSIPSPLPGTKFNVDAGVEFSFNVLDRTAVMINEVEMNPSGRDHSNEWVELFNPSPYPVDLTDWVLATSRGQKHSESLRGEIPAYGYFVHRFTGQALDNGDVKGFPLQESVTLLNREGERMDSAPWMKDLHDDERTWQRSFDGSSRWELRIGTEGRSNGAVLFTEMGTGQLLALIEECFFESFERFIDSGLDIFALDELISDALLRLKERMLDSVEATVSSLKFFIQLGLADVTGTVSGGLSVALVYDGRAVRACLEWLIDAVGEVLRDPLNPLAAGQRAEVPTRTLANHVYLQMGAYVSVGAPDLIPMAKGLRVTAMAGVKVNIGALGAFGGGSEWDVSFGLVISGPPAVKVKGGGITMKGCCYDVWLLRGSLRPA